MTENGKRKRSVKKLEVVDRQLRALELRKAGVGFERIARELGYKSASGAHKAVETALKNTLREPADQVRMLELERLDKLLFGLWKRATQGDAESVAHVLKIMDRRARLLGLDILPKQPIEVSGPEGGPMDISVTARETAAAELDAWRKQVTEKISSELSALATAPTSSTVT